MPRYYFHLLDERTADLVRDSAGASLRNASEAKREAIGLAHDIIRHRLHGSTWQVVVTDANANVVLKVSLSNVQPRKIEVAFDRVCRIARRMALYEPRTPIPHFHLAADGSGVRADHGVGDVEQHVTTYGRDRRIGCAESVIAPWNAIEKPDQLAAFFR